MAAVERAASRVRLWVPLLACSVLPIAPATGQESPPGGPLVHAFQEEVDLETLVGYFGQELGIGIDWNPVELSGRFTFHTGPGVRLDALWATTNRQLLGRGLACVQVAGEDSLSIVKLEQAARLARIESGDPARTQAGYVRVLRPLRSREPSEVAAALLEVLPKDGSVSALLQGTSQLMIAGLKPQVLEALEVLQLIDAAPAPTVVEELPAENLSPTALAALLEQVAQKRKAAGETGLRGSVLALTGIEGVLVIAPETEVPLWRSLAGTLDRGDAVVTRSYTPRHAGLREMAGLVESVVGGGGETWRLVVDDLSGCLWISGTLSEHELVEAVFKRVGSTDGPPRRTMRAVALEHRDSDELVGMLEKLVQAGVVLSEAESNKGGATPAEEDTRGPTAPMPGQSTPLRSPEGPAPDELTFSSDAATNRVLLFGEAPLVEQAETLVRSLDVAGPQVLVETIVVSLDESEMADLGVELRKRGTADGDLFELASLFGIGAPNAGSSSIPPIETGGFTGVVLGPGSYSAAIAALETATKGRSVSRPRVLVGNHGEARLEAVLHRPYASINATNTVATTSLGGTEDAGTSVRVTPHITSGQKLRLDYDVSISAFIGEPSDPSLPPPRQETVLDSEVTVPDGYAVVVGGIELESQSRSESRVPILGEIPLVGQLFRTQSKSRSKSRFFVFIRTSILSGSSLEGLRWASVKPLETAGVDDGWPKLAPRVMR